MEDFIFTSESVAEGHPDKVCDQISDTILDHYLMEDPHVRAGIEAVATTNRVILLGEVTSSAPLSHERLTEIVRAQVKKIGYEQEGFHWQKLNVDIYLNEQSRDIARGIDSDGAGDQGLMFGYASNETSALMPAPLYYSHRLLEHLSKDRHQGKCPALGPDGKAQLSLRYINGIPVEATSIVLSIQHSPDLDQQDLEDILSPYIERAIPADWITESTRILINPTGRFVVGGPDGDSGMTGRKIIVDTYGGAAPHGGGAFSGKDPTKVDRSGAYMARHLAKNVVGAGLAGRCTIQISYAIGKAEPTSFYVNTHGTGVVHDARIAEVLRYMMTLTPRNIRETLELNRSIYESTATYGHFGRSPTNDGKFPWERLDLRDQLRSEFL